MLASELFVLCCRCEFPNITSESLHGRSRHQNPAGTVHLLLEAEAGIDNTCHYPLWSVPSHLSKALLVFNPMGWLAAQSPHDLDTSGAAGSGKPTEGHEPPPHPCLKGQALHCWQAHSPTPQALHISSIPVACERNLAGKGNACGRIAIEDNTGFLNRLSFQS